MKQAIEAFDRFLAHRRPPFEAVVIGGAALILLGIVQRETLDVDVLDPPIPDDIRKAAVRFARSYRGGALPLRDDWLNDGPQSLRKDLPAGWKERAVPLYAGKSLRLRTLARPDLLRAKLYAYCDRQEDLPDCLAMRPEAGELRDCFPWLRERDAHPLWPEHVRKSLRMLAERLGYEYDPGR